MAFTITTTKDSASSRIFLRRQTPAAITKPLEPVIHTEDALDHVPTRREAEVTRA